MIRIEGCVMKLKNMSPRTKRIWNWVFSVLCIIECFAFFPSISSILMLICGVASMPPVRKIWSYWQVKNSAHNAVFAVLFVIAALIAPDLGSVQSAQSVPPGHSAGRDVSTISRENTSSKSVEPSSAISNAVSSAIDSSRSSQEATKPESSKPESAMSSSNPVSIPAQTSEPSIAPPAPEGNQTAASQPTENPPVNSQPVPQSTGETPADPIATPPQSTPETSSKVQLGQYVGSIESDKYHYPGCRWAEKILPENAIWFNSVEEAKAAGYSACGVCHPPVN